MYFVDAHTHTYFSPDSKTPPVKLCERAVALGIDAVYITDHCDVNGWDGEAYDFRRNEAYNEIAELRAHFPSLFIGFGAELGQQQQNNDLAQETLADPRLDFVIGSMHSLAGELDFFFMKGKDTDGHALWLRYFDELKLHVKHSDFDVLGHITYPKRYIQTNWCAEYDERVDEILKIVISRGKGIEINTSGLYKELGETLPPPPMVRRYRELGGEIVTIGSDCHLPEQLGACIKEGYEIAKAAGFEYIPRFVGRRPEFIRL